MDSEAITELIDSLHATGDRLLRIATHLSTNNEILEELESTLDGRLGRIATALEKIAKDGIITYTKVDQP